MKFSRIEEVGIVVLTKSRTVLQLFNRHLSAKIHIERLIYYAYNI